MTMKAHTYYIIFGRPPIGGEASPLPPGGATVCSSSSSSSSEEERASEFVGLDRLHAAAERFSGYASHCDTFAETQNFFSRGLFSTADPGSLPSVLLPSVL